MTYPVLYSFRRCPYAMRARLAIASVGLKVELREVVLREKPAAMLAASPKGTVPVLVLPTGQVIDESLDVMLWALGQNDPEGWLVPETGDRAAMLALIAACDGDFKHHLDRFKYASRYDGADPDQHFAGALEFLYGLEARLSDTDWLFGTRASLADYAVLPFVRQFVSAAGARLDTVMVPKVQRWLLAFTSGARFKAVMIKYPQWQEGEKGATFP